MIETINLVIAIVALVIQVMTRRDVKAKT